MRSNLTLIVAALACCTLIGCSKACKGVFKDEPTLEEDPATIDDAPDGSAPARKARCAREGGKLRVPGSNVEFGEAVPFRGGYAISVVRTENGNAARGVGLVDPDLTKFEFVAIAPFAAMSEPVKLLESAGDLYVAYDDTPVAAKRGRSLVVSKLAKAGGEPKLVARVDREDSDDDASYTFAVDQSGAMLVGFEHQAKTRSVLRLHSGPELKKFVDLEGEPGDIENPRLRAGKQGFFVAFLSVNLENLRDAGRDPNEAPGEERKERTLYVGLLDSNGIAKKPLMALSSGGNHVSDFAFAPNEDALLIHDDTEILHGDGTQLLRVILTDSSPAVTPWLARGVGRASVDPLANAALFLGSDEQPYFIRTHEKTGTEEPAFAASRALLVTGRGTAKTEIVAASAAELFLVRCAN